MKMSILEMVQDIANDIDSDEINSIDDTTESQQIAQIIKSTYFSLMHVRNWRGNKQLLGLTASGDNALPTHFYLPDNLSELVLVNYDCVRTGQTQRVYRNMKYLYPDEFLRRQNELNTDNDNVDIIQDPTGVELLIRNDIPPTYWTSFDDKAMVFDAYDKLVDDTLKTSKCQALGYVTPSWSMVDDFVPVLPEEAFSLLLEESKSATSLKLRQVADQKAEQRAQEQDRWLSRKQWRTKGGVRYPSYGRKGRK